MWLWPRTGNTRRMDPWSHSLGLSSNQNDRTSHSFSFKTGYYSHLKGQLNLDDLEEPSFSKCTYLAVSNRDRNNKFPALPERCPSCEASRSQTAQIRQNFEKGRVISPIRGLSTGLGATVNLVSGNACYHLGEEGTLADTIIFNDSRATASDTAAFLDKLHFSDLIRQLIIKNLQSVDVWSRQYIEEIYSTPDGDRSEKQKKDRERIKSLNSEVDKLLRLKDSDIEIDEAEENLIEGFFNEYTGDRKNNLARFKCKD